MSHPVPERLVVPGHDGPIEILVEAPRGDIHGIALVAHPHPLFGGTLDNKVVQTLARAFRDLGLVAIRPNFRGVGQSAGTHDEGEAETEDQLAVLDWAFQRYGDLPVTLGGFSFGAYVTTRVAARLASSRRPVHGMVLAGLAAGGVEGIRHYTPESVPEDALLIHGQDDEVVPLANVLAWAGPQNLPVSVLGGTGHFFHGKLTVLRTIIHRALAHRVGAGAEQP